MMATGGKGFGIETQIDQSANAWASHFVIARQFRKLRGYGA